MEARGLKPHPWAKQAGVSPASIYNFIRGDSDSLNQRTLDRLAAAAGVTAEALTSGTVTALREPEDVAYLPEGQGGNYYPAIIAVLHPGRDKAFPMLCGSTAMNLSGFLPGDTLIVDPEAVPRDGDAVIVQVYDDNTGTAETLFRGLEGAYLIPRSTDAGFRPETFEPDRVRLVGVAIDRFRGRALEQAATAR